MFEPCDGSPALGLPVRDVEAIAAGVDLDAHAARLAEVEVVLLAHPVPARTELDRGVGVQQDVGGAQQLLARVDPPGEVVDAALRARVVEDEPEVVRLLVVGAHREHDDVGLLVQHRVLGEVEPSVSRYHSASRTGSSVSTVTWSIWRGAMPRGT